MSTFTLTGGLVGDILGGIASTLNPYVDPRDSMVCHNAIEEAELSYQSELLDRMYMDNLVDRAMHGNQSRRGDLSDVHYSNYRQKRREWEEKYGREW